MPELLHEVPSDEELTAYCDQHLADSIFSLIRESRSKLEKIYPVDILLAIEALRALGCEQFCQLAMMSIRESHRRLNGLSRTDTLWANTNKRPTIYKVGDFCRRILRDEPHDLLSFGHWAPWLSGTSAITLASG